MSKQHNLQWLYGEKSLGEVCGWETEEVRIVADLGFALAEQGREREAVTIFEGLAAVSPHNNRAYAYFQSALGALRLRLDNPHKAVAHLTASLNIDADNISVLVNRGEAYLKLKEYTAASADFQRALNLGESEGDDYQLAPFLVRARVLLGNLPNLERAALIKRRR